jgi:hypothetical protein
VIGVDQGITHGHFTAADICFLIALIVFVIAAVMTWPLANTRWATLVAAGLAAISLGWLLL